MNYHERGILRAIRPLVHGADPERGGRRVGLSILPPGRNSADLTESSDSKMPLGSAMDPDPPPDGQEGGAAGGGGLMVPPSLQSTQAVSADSVYSALHECALSRPLFW